MKIAFIFLILFISAPLMAMHDGTPPDASLNIQRIQFISEIESQKIADPFTRRGQMREGLVECLRNQEQFADLRSGDENLLAYIKPHQSEIDLLWAMIFNQNCPSINPDLQEIKRVSAYQDKNIRRQIYWTLHGDPRSVCSDLNQNGISATCLIKILTTKKI